MSIRSLPFSARDGALCSILCLALTAGCSTEVLNPIDLIGDDGAGGALEPTPGDGGDDTTSDPNKTRLTLQGDVTWTVTFDEDAKAAGATDCSYTRRYTGVENSSRPWGCPTCDARFRADVEMVEGLTDCYEQVTPREPAEVEWLGYGGGPWFRGSGALLAEQGTALVEGNTVTVANVAMDIEAPVGGLLQFDVAGTLTIGEEQGDPEHGFVAADSYTCGWPKADPPPYDGDYVLAIGSVVPDGIFEDACEENVRLHDFAGAYLVVDMAAVDCPPCRQMAALEEQFVEEMSAAGIEVHVVTLLAPSLDDPLGETTKAHLDAWNMTFALTSPVLADRGWGLAEFSPAIGDETGYPSWAIVAPNLEVIDFGTGFGGWGSMRATIENHAAGP